MVATSERISGLIYGTLCIARWHNSTTDDCKKPTEWYDEARSKSEADFFPDCGFMQPHCDHVR